MSSAADRTVRPEPPRPVAARLVPAAKIVIPELPPDFALQSPADYIETLEHIVPGALKDAGVDPADVVGIGLDFTSATVLACRSDSTPLCLSEGEPVCDQVPHFYASVSHHFQCRAGIQRSGPV